MNLSYTIGFMFGGTGLLRVPIRVLKKNMVGGFLKKYRNVSIVQGIILIVG